MKPGFKLVVFAVLYRVLKGRTEIMTQTRNPNFRKPDPLYGGLEETVAETVRSGEEIMNALARGIREETGVNDFRLKSPSGNSLIRKRIKTNTVCGYDSLCWTEAHLTNRSLRGPAFLVDVGIDFIPTYGNGPDAEAINCRWWDVQDLTKRVKKDPSKFVAYHLPALIAATRYFSKSL